VVFWNFTLAQERDILADLTFSSISTGISLASRPQDEADFETEELHFEYDGNVERPRIFNDMITLRSGDHMIKLAMSHAIAQSTKLSFFEERMNDTMGNAKEVPKRLALTGELGMERKEIVMILGRLFKSRVDVNLCKLRFPTSKLTTKRNLSSIEHPRCTEFLLGCRTNTSPALFCHPRISRNCTENQGSKRTLPCLP